MNKKITFLAFGVNCGSFGASGLRGLSAAAAWLAKKPSPESKPVKASPVKPAPASQRNSRRVRRQKAPVGLGWSDECWVISNLRRYRNTKVGVGYIVSSTITFPDRQE